MKAYLNLQQKLENRLSLTPQVKQSLEILKFSIGELEQFIRDEANGNPLIELKEPDALMEMARIPNSSNSSFLKEKLVDPFLHVAQQDTSIEAYLNEQLAVNKALTKREKEIVLYFIRNLNEQGFLDCEIEDTAERFQVTIEKCEELVHVLQSLEPAGIGARSLAECLYLQVVRRGDAPGFTEILIQKHLEDLANRDFQKLAYQYEIAKEDVESIFEYIQQLNPRPLMEVPSTKQELIIPDILVEEVNREWILHINDRFLPQISISTFYEELLRSSVDGETQNYLKTKLSDAFLLMRGIEQRHETLYKVVESMLQKQSGFMHKGKKALVPLRLKDIADRVGLHESTVSRTISHKYIQTPHGTLALKSFFVRGVKMRSGEVELSLSIKEKIKAIIETEPCGKPLSDQKIANLLLAEGIPIARRTVAKYREELGILQSTKRRR